MIKTILCEKSYWMVVLFQIALIILKLANVVCGEWWIVFLPTYAIIASIILSIILMLYVNMRIDKR